MDQILIWARQNRIVSLLALSGMVLTMIGGVWYWNSREPVEVEIISGQQVAGASDSKLIVDVQGAVVQPGVYELALESRLKDAILAAGGLSASADRIWVARYLNLAEKVVDGAKIFIPGERTSGITNNQLPMTNDSSHSVAGFIDINTATLSELDSLSGIGEVRAQAIVDGRPYGKIEELVSKKIVPQSVFDKIKASISVF